MWPVIWCHTDHMDHHGSSNRVSRYFICRNASAVAPQMRANYNLVVRVHSPCAVELFSQCMTIFIMWLCETSSLPLFLRIMKIYGRVALIKHTRRSSAPAAPDKHCSEIFNSIDKVNWPVFILSNIYLLHAMRETSHPILCQLNEPWGRSKNTGLLYLFIPFSTIVLFGSFGITKMSLYNHDSWNGS